MTEFILLLYKRVRFLSNKKSKKKHLNEAIKFYKSKKKDSRRQEMTEQVYLILSINQ